MKLKVEKEKLVIELKYCQAPKENFKHQSYEQDVCYGGNKNVLEAADEERKLARKPE